MKRDQPKGEYRGEEASQQGKTRAGIPPIPRESRADGPWASGTIMFKADVILRAGVIWVDVPKARKQAVLDWLRRYCVDVTHWSNQCLSIRTKPERAFQPAGEVGVVE